jgi:ABC-type nitrate/sulfonate/bicarbonate transport system substrate-binding protein
VQGGGSNLQLFFQRRKKLMLHYRKLIAQSAAGLALAVGTGLFSGSVGAQALEKVKFGFAQNAVSPIVINFIVPQFLGYYKEEGLEVELITLGTNAAVMAGLD